MFTSRATDEGSLPEIVQYGPYYLPLNDLTASKGSYLNILLTSLGSTHQLSIVLSVGTSILKNVDGHSLSAAHSMLKYNACSNFDGKRD